MSFETAEPVGVRPLRDLLRAKLIDAVVAKGADRQKVTAAVDNYVADLKLDGKSLLDVLLSLPWADIIKLILQLIVIL